MKKIVAIIFDLDGTLYPRNSPYTSPCLYLLDSGFESN